MHKYFCLIFLILSYVGLQSGVPLRAQIVVLTSTTTETAEADEYPPAPSPEASNSQTNSSEMTPSSVQATAEYSSAITDSEADASFTTTLTVNDLSGTSQESTQTSAFGNDPLGDGSVYVATASGQSAYQLTFSVQKTTQFVLNLDLSGQSTFQLQTTNNVYPAGSLNFTANYGQSSDAGIFYSGNTYKLNFSGEAGDASNTQDSAGTDGDSEMSQFSIALVPEPSSASMIIEGSGALFLVVCVRHFHRKRQSN